MSRILAVPQRRNAKIHRQLQRWVRHLSPTTTITKSGQQSMRSAVAFIKREGEFSRLPNVVEVPAEEEDHGAKEKIGGQFPSSSPASAAGVQVADHHRCRRRRGSKAPALASKPPNSFLLDLSYYCVYGVTLQTTPEQQNMDGCATEAEEGDNGEQKRRLLEVARWLRFERNPAPARSLAENPTIYSRFVEGGIGEEDTRRSTCEARDGVGSLAYCWYGHMPREVEEEGEAGEGVIRPWLVPCTLMGVPHRDNGKRAGDARLLPGLDALLIAPDPVSFPRSAVGRNRQREHAADGDPGTNACVLESAPALRISLLSVWGQQDEEEKGLRPATTRAVASLFEWWCAKPQRLEEEGKTFLSQDELFEGASNEAVAGWRPPPSSTPAPTGSQGAEGRTLMESALRRVWRRVGLREDSLDHRVWGVGQVMVVFPSLPDHHTMISLSSSNTSSSSMTTVEWDGSSAAGWWTRPFPCLSSSCVYQALVVHYDQNDNVHENTHDKRKDGGPLACSAASRVSRQVPPVERFEKQRRRNSGNPSQVDRPAGVGKSCWTCTQSRWGSVCETHFATARRFHSSLIAYGKRGSVNGWVEECGASPSHMGEPYRVFGIKTIGEEDRQVLLRSLGRPVYPLDYGVWPPHKTNLMHKALKKGKQKKLRIDPKGLAGEAPPVGRTAGCFDKFDSRRGSMTPHRWLYSLRLWGCLRNADRRIVVRPLRQTSFDRSLSHWMRWNHPGSVDGPALSCPRHDGIHRRPVTTTIQPYFSSFSSSSLLPQTHGEAGARLLLVEWTTVALPVPSSRMTAFSSSCCSADEEDAANSSERPLILGVDVTITSLGIVTSPAYFMDRLGCMVAPVWLCFSPLLRERNTAGGSVKQEREDEDVSGTGTRMTMTTGTRTMAPDQTEKKKSTRTHQEENKNEEEEEKENAHGQRQSVLVLCADQTARELELRWRAMKGQCLTPAPPSPARKRPTAPAACPLPEPQMRIRTTEKVDEKGSGGVGEEEGSNPSHPPKANSKNRRGNGRSRRRRRRCSTEERNGREGEDVGTSDWRQGKNDSHNIACLSSFLLDRRSCTWVEAVEMHV